MPGQTRPGAGEERRQEVLAALRARIARIEPLPGLGEPEAGLTAGHPLGLPRGVVHEVFAEARRHAGTALGFALGAARTLRSADRPAIFIVQPARDGQDIGMPYAAGFTAFGIDPAAIVLCRPETPVELLWAVEEALACRAVAAVIADVGRAAKLLDFTATRRLSLRSAAGGGTAFLIRYGMEREATAARYRWRVAPAASGEPAFDPRAPGPPRLAVELEKGRVGGRKAPLNWMLESTENGFVVVEPQPRTRHPDAAGTPVPRAPSAALGDRLSKTG